MNPADSLSRAIYNHFSAKPSFDAELTEEEVVFLKSLRLFPPEEAFERIVMRYDLQERREEIATCKPCTNRSSTSARAA